MDKYLLTKPHLCPIIGQFYHGKSSKPSRLSDGIKHPVIIRHLIARRITDGHICMTGKV